ncbi:hypothetical protein VN97_g2117 [Penicillium thymicola]|uniref:Uncharacterized protein n=1 Tax=Penicillium thymicola TaxID=293382 RepID=A0AAI9TQ76_PENTH|nr:hypothetical protein VN97_g2117 [Penicillium thymicola]
MEGLCSCECRSLDKRHAKTTDDEDALIQTHYMQPMADPRQFVHASSLRRTSQLTKYLAENDQGEQGSQLPLPHAFSTHDAARGASRFRRPAWTFSRSTVSPAFRCFLIFFFLLRRAVVSARNSIVSILGFRPRGHQ